MTTKETRPSDDSGAGTATTSATASVVDRPRICPGCGATAVVPNRAIRRAQARQGYATPPGAAVITHHHNCRHQAASVARVGGPVRMWIGGAR